MYCKSKKFLRIHSEKRKKVLPLGSSNNVPKSSFCVVQKMCHRAYPRRKIRKVVLPAEEFNEG